MSSYTDQMTEKQVREEIARLEKVLNAGDATASQANRLDELRRSLRRISEVKNRYSPSW